MPPAANKDLRVLAAEAAFASIPPERLSAALATTNLARPFDRAQTRVGEEHAAITDVGQLFAVATSPGFWELAKLLPGNDISQHRRGRPADYPDWLLFLLCCASAFTGVCSLRAAAALLDQPQLWAQFAEHVDRYVPKGMTHIGDLSRRQARPAHLKARPATPPRATAARPMQPRVTASQWVSVPPVPPPSPHHLDYFLVKWRGRDKTGQSVPPGHPWHRLRQRIIARFEAISTVQAQQMGLLDPQLDFQYQRPLRSQYAGFDGTVMPVSRRHKGDPAREWKTGDGRTVYGSKYTIASTRVSGEAHSRVFLAFAQTGKSRDSVYPDEEKAVLDMATRLRDLSDGGLKGIVVDSAIRGHAVSHLQRQSLTVVNYPHAQSNPDGGPGKRLTTTRQEKNHLRRISIHTDENGTPCEHFIYAFGGELVQLVETDEGHTIARLPVTKYEQRRNSDGSRREYKTVQIDCDIAGPYAERVALFHTDATSTDPAYNWGEVVRVFAPSSAEFQYLYGARNDTEARHADLKSRIKYLPPDVAGQDLRMLAAMVTANAVAWQVHLQARQQANIFDGTA